jgi:hypothetical protein
MTISEPPVWVAFFVAKNNTYRRAGRDKNVTQVCGDWRAVGLGVSLGDAFEMKIRQPFTMKLDVNRIQH